MNAGKMVDASRRKGLTSFLERCMERVRNVYERCMERVGNVEEGCTKGAGGEWRTGVDAARVDVDFGLFIHIHFSGLKNEDTHRGTQLRAGGLREEEKSESAHPSRGVLFFAL